MRTGRPKAELTLTAEERHTLEQWSRRPKAAQAVARRARLVLACAMGKSNQAVAAEFGATGQTVGRWRQRFVAQRLDGLLDEPRPGPPRRTSDAEVERLLALTLETTPKTATHWSSRVMAATCGLSQSTVSRIWRAFGLQPHRTETGKSSSDPPFIEQVRDVVGLYLNPPDRVLVLWVDEKAQIQALDRTRPSAMRPGQVERRTPDYRRPGTSSLIAALNVKTGQVIGQLHQRQRAREFRKFLDTIAATVPAQLNVHLILDHDGTHKAALIQRWLLKQRRFHVHCTPTRASWFSLVERGFALLTEKQLRRGVHRSTQALQAAIRAYIAHTNKHPKPFVWTKTAEEILVGVARFCHRTSDSGH
ncbi:MAG TPA: IS630 family transposase [Candidatus Angelobacter sp.]|nr:IS630 family transposase [Candidatus Angelobacter sp.]